MSLTSPQQVYNTLATSLLYSCNGIWETKRHNSHDGLLPAPTCYRLVADLLRGNWCNGFRPYLCIIYSRYHPDF